MLTVSRPRHVRLMRAGGFLVLEPHAVHMRAVQRFRRRLIQADDAAAVRMRPQIFGCDAEREACDPRLGDELTGGVHPPFPGPSHALDRLHLGQGLVPLHGDRQRADLQHFGQPGRHVAQGFGIVFLRFAHRALSFFCLDNVRATASITPVAGRREMRPRPS